jgi:nucleoid-associated protein YgaU
MPNDAKLGLVVGVVLVIAIATVFFRKEEAPANARIVGEIRGQPTAKTGTLVSTPRQHTVQEGDTLFGLAQRYYQDDRRFVDIYQANRDVVETPNHLTPGTVLVIP